MAVPNSLIQVALRAELHDQIDMGFCLERMDEIHNVGMTAEAAVKGVFFRLVIDGEVETGFTRRRLLGEALDGHRLVRQEILRHEDHTERAMVERRNGLESAIQEDAANELFSQAFHDEQGVKEKKFVGEDGKQEVVVQDSRS